VNSEGRGSPDLDLVAGLVTGFLLLLITLAIVIGAQIGIRVTAQFPTGNTVGPYQALTLTFSEPVDGSLAVQKFSIQPAVKGKFQWTDSKTLRFIPVEPYQPGTVYTFSFTSGQLTNNGGALKKPRSWKFQIRQPLIVYLVIDHQKSRLWTIERDNGKISALTDDSFKIFDFDASHNGEFVIFSAINEQKGMDLWRVNRAGGTALLLLPCGPDRCSNPAISPDGRRVAYVREAAGPTPDLAYGSPRIRVVDVESKQDSPLYEDQQIIGIRPEWSPDGTRLASYDGIKDEFRLLELVTGNQFTISSQTGGMVTWSADSSTFVYTDVDTNEFGLHTRIREAKIAINEITTLLGEKDEHDYHYSSLAWSPADSVLAIGFRPNPDNPEEALWLMNSATLDGQTITDQHGYIYNNPIWDPWGKALIFEQFKLKGVYKPEISLWARNMNQPRIVAEGIMPHWLP
jgi:Tol biopolymer transport system component